MVVAFGVFPILMGLGIITPTDGPPPARWVLIAAGLLFVFFGATVILDFAIGHGAGPDGNFVPGTPFYVRAGNYGLLTAIVGLLAAVFGWVSLAGVARGSDRLFFGFFTILFVWAFVACVVAGVRKIVRRRPRDDSS